MEFGRSIGGQRNFNAKLIIVALLSFGLGSAVLLWTALNRLLLHPLTVAHPETLVRVAEKHAWLVSRDALPYSTYGAVRRMRSLEDVAAEGEVDTTVRIGGGVRPVLAHMVSGNYFRMLGVRAELGRTFDSADDTPRTGGVPILLAHRFWVTHFRASPSVIGSTLIVQERPLIIAGVLPRRFFGTRLDSNPDVWLPLSAQPLVSGKALTDPEPDTVFSIVARLRPGVTLAAAQGEFAGIYRGIAEKERINERISDTNSQGILEPIATGAFALHDPFVRALTLLVWGWLAILLMMCANVAGLLLAQAARHERDAAIRLSLGAGRWHLTLRALRETMALGLAGGVGGVALAWFCAPILLRLLPAGRTPLSLSLAPGMNTGALAMGLALVLSVFFGGIPAWISANVSPERTLRRGTATRRPGRLSRALLMLQTGLTLVLLTETGLLLRTFYVLRHTSPGFEADHLICFTLDPGMAGTATPPPATLPLALADQVRQLPEVDNATLANAALMRRIGLKTSVALPGTKIPPEAFLNTSIESVSNSFFDTMRIPLLKGRGFAEADATRANPTPVIVNEAFARMFFRGGSAIGKTFGTGPTASIATAENVIVGVVGDSKYRSLREALLPIYYSPIRQRPDWSGRFTFTYARVAIRRR